MTKIRDLKKPPIKEAIIHVSFKQVVNNIDELKKFFESEYIKENYGQIGSNMLFEIKNEPNKPPVTKQIQEGFILKCKNDSNKSIQLKVGQLSFHNTNNYLGWIIFFNEFKTIWDCFCKTVGKTDLTLIGARYINQLDFELPLEKGFNEYLHFLPALPKGVNPNINNFFIQVNTPNDDNSLAGIITETYGIISQIVQVILDINVTSQKDFVCNSEEMWSTLENIHDYKNNLFFNCVTEKTLKKYE